ncbi:MAG: glycosyl transferase [Marmoricola sp.]|nr:glycosyl transferase [Marmoricola sp.]
MTTTTSTLERPPVRTVTTPPAPADPSWTRPALVVLLIGTALLYLWGLGASGWANSFYSAAVQAGSESWKAFFFGSSDAANSITVDKTPLSLWPMALSVRVFGLSSWSILVPQALFGVATVALLHHTVRRVTGSAVAGLIAGLVMALTPVAVLMFRFNNPDALLALLLLGAGTATLRAVEDSKVDAGRPLRWLVLAGSLVGLAFLTKMMQAFLVLPALALVYLLFARTSWGRKVVHLLAAFGAMLLAGGWWVAIVELCPAASRPYIGGSQNNSILELTLGYNGLGRLSGNETGSVGGAGGGTGSMWGATGIGRLFSSEVGGQIAWLLPAALVLGAAALWWTRTATRANRRIGAAIVMFGTTLVVTGLTFSFMAGIFHAYYTVALAPAIAALIGIGAWTLWRERQDVIARAVLAASVAGTAVLAYVLLDRSASFVPWVRVLVILGGTVAAGGLLGVHRMPKRWALAVAGLGLATVLAGPASYALETASTPHSGSIPTAGPTVAGAQGGPGGGRGGAPGGFRGAFGGRLPTGQPPTGAQAGGFGGPPGQGTQVAGSTRTGGQAGGLLNASTPSAALVKALGSNSSNFTWAAAAIGSNTASGYQLATQLPVMAIGGFNGSDPSPTLPQFEAYVKAGKIHWFIAGGGQGGGGGGPSAGGSTSSAISAWVEAHFTATTVSGITLYDLSGSTS